MPPKPAGFQNWSALPKGSEDEAAVRAGIRSPWNQGMVEGFNNKIKRLKRLLYGLGGFDRLRKRILHTNAAS